MCNALIDTGTTKSCNSERYYQQLPSTKMQCLKNISVKSAMGSNLTPLDIIHCTFELVRIKFNSNLIVCRNLTIPLIQGRDFLLQHHITVCYAADGRCILDYQQHELVVYQISHSVIESIWKVLSETELKFSSKLTSFCSQRWLLLLVCLGKCFPLECPKECCSIQFLTISIIMVFICSKML